MTTDEAIQIMEEIEIQFERSLPPDCENYLNDAATDEAEKDNLNAISAIDLAISALRAQPERQPPPTPQSPRLRGVKADER